MAAFPVNDSIDLKLELPSCELCGEDFKTSANRANDKYIHLTGHFREDLMKDRLNPKTLFYAMRRELGDSWKIPTDPQPKKCTVFTI